MSAKLLFITSHYFYQPTVDALARLKPDCETKVVPYDDYIHISELYGTYADSCDACLTTGVVAMNAILMAYPHPPTPLYYFQISANALHRDILKVMLDTGNTDLGRIAMDFLVAVGGGYSVADFLKLEELDNAYSKNTSLTQQIGIRNGHTVEHYVLEKITDLWKSGAIDLVICQYSSIVPMLEQRGIPFRCSFVSDQHLNSVIQEVLIKIELNRHHENHPAIIQIFPRYSTEPDSRRISAIRELLQSYTRSNLIDCVLQENDACCVLITTLRVLRFLTEEFRKCRICAFLESHLEFPVSAAYGIGTTVPHAMNNVQIASKEAKLTGRPFVVDTNGNLIGPLNSESCMVIASSSLPDVSEVAKRCGLSAMTIQKLQNIVCSNGSDKVTVPEMAQKLNTTVRNANRIMQHLCRGNVARPVYTQTTHSRGRPVQVYLLDFGRM